MKIIKSGNKVIGIIFQDDIVMSDTVSGDYASHIEAPEESIPLSVAEYIESVLESNSQWDRFGKITVDNMPAEGSHQEAGICPVCGSPDLHYDSLKIDGLQVGYPWICNTCKSSGEEWYELHFIEHINIEKDEDEASPRTCSHCGKGMHAGYCIEGGESYYCSDECLHANMTEEEYLELYDDGNGDSYWTEWEEE